MTGVFPRRGRNFLAGVGQDGDLTDFRMRETLSVMNPTERIAHEPHNEDGWICLCGNVPCNDGFYTCDANGNEVEPIASEWTSGLYVCAACGRMIDPHTLEVRGRNPNPILLV